MSKVTTASPIGYIVLRNDEAYLPSEEYRPFEDVEEAMEALDDHDIEDGVEIKICPVLPPVKVGRQQHCIKWD